MTNAANQDHFDCKEKFLNIIFHIEQAYDDDDFLTAETLGSWKKELTSKIKDFEKKYVKHGKAKSTNEQLAKIHTEAMQPVTDLCKSGVDLDNFYKMAAKKPVPDFRKKALTAKFIEYCSNVCRILRGWNNLEGKTLDKEYDIAHILELLETPNWRDIPPFRFYIEPLKVAFDELIKVLRHMQELGPLRMSYYVERNTEMTKKIYTLIDQYTIVKELAGDDLKRDQFKFMYNIHEIVYSSALKNDYLSEQFGAHVLKVVVPELTAFKSMLLIRDIDDQKAIDIDKKQKRKEEREALGQSEEEEEELKLDLPPQPVTKNKKKKQEIDPEIIEAARQVALFKRELATYGVSISCVFVFMSSHSLIFTCCREPGSGRTITKMTLRGKKDGKQVQML